MEILRRLFEKHFAAPATSVVALQGALGASGRRIFRLRNAEHTAIGILYDSREENVAFLSFSRHFRSLGLPVPEIYVEDLDAGAYLQQDLGDVTLFQFLAEHRDGAVLQPSAIAAYRKVIAMLPRFQVEGGVGLDYAVCYPRAEFDSQSMAWDLNYFKYFFLRLSRVKFHEQALQNDFDALTAFLFKAPRDYFLYRDFQSRNIMLVPGLAKAEPYFLDYQGGRRGALQYDIASLLFDAKADLPLEFREQMLQEYLVELAKHTVVHREEFLRYYYGFVLIRILQALGAYGFRGYYERKPLFLASVPYALKNVAWLLESDRVPIALPALTDALRQALAAQPATQSEPAADSKARLTVRIGSFSYHRGLPQDGSGHGGGFLFDARALPNPGRQAEFRSLTGCDAEVAEFLEQQPEVAEYFSHALALVQQSVESYQSRGFEHLSAFFGCTGGQHRSVFLAEKLARELRKNSAIQVTLEHREFPQLNNAG